MSTPCMIVQIPGPVGSPGADGTNGTNGENAYTTVTANFDMPAEGATVVVTVGNTGWMAVGQKVFAGVTGGAARGTFEVSAIVSSTSVTLLNIEDTATDAYTDNSAPGTTFPAGTVISPSGLQGSDGADGSSGAPDDATYLTQTAEAGLSAEVPLDTQSTGLMHVTNGVGFDATVPTGVADDNVVTVDQVAGLTAGDCAFGTAAGIETKTAANARTALGLGTMAVQNANNVAITGGTITGVTLATPSGIPVSELIYEHQAASATESGAANIGGWNVVPLTTEVLDMGGYGTIAANTVTIKAGTYRISWQVMGYLIDQFVTRLFNATTSLLIAYGNSACAASALGTPSVTAVSTGVTRVTFAVDTDLQLQLYCTTQNLTNAYGKACGLGFTEVYSRLVLVKETT